MRRLILGLIVSVLAAFSRPAWAVDRATDCAIFRDLLAAEPPDPPPPPPRPGERRKPIVRAAVPAPDHWPAVFVDRRPQMTETVRSEVLALSSGRGLRLRPGELTRLKAAARVFEGDGDYRLNCYWDQNLRPVRSLAPDWDVRLRPSDPAVKRDDFDPFKHCPQSNANDPDWTPPRGAPSRTDCQAAYEASFPRRFFSRPIVTADGRLAAVMEGGWVYPPARGAYGIVLLRYERGIWREVGTILGVKT